MAHCVTVSSATQLDIVAIGVQVREVLDEGVGDVYV
jgi:hypothetical protein